MKRVARLLAAIAFLAPVAAFGQVPGGDELAINKTPIIGGTTGRCLYDNAGKVGEQVCAGVATSITINTTTITGGSTTRVLYDNAGTIGEYTNTQLTALINAATASLSGALPAWPNNTTTFFRGDGTYATLNCSALGGSGAFCAGTDAANLTGTVASARLSGSYTGITGVGALAAGSAGAGFSINLTGVTLTNAVPAANGGAGTITGALKGNGAGVVSQAACADLSNGATGCSTVVGTAATQNYTAGSWTPTLVGSSTSGTGQTYGIQTGSYEQIGRQVTIRFSVQATSLGTAAGNMQIGGLPFPTANAANEQGNCVMGTYSVAGLAALNYGVVGTISPNTSLIDLRSNGNAATALVTVAQTGASGVFFGSCTYRSS